MTIPATTSHENAAQRGLSQTPPSLSVVVPAYNAIRSIAHTLHSILSQSRLADEIIVVDDGSVDGTAEAVSAIGADITVIRQANSGSAVARQTGGVAATGDYVVYLDADDWWPVDRLERVEAILASEPIDFMLTDFQRQRFDRAAGVPVGEPLARNREFYPDALRLFASVGAATAVEGLIRVPPDNAVELLLGGFPVYPSTAVIRRAVLDEVGGWDARFKRSQDFELGLRIVRRFPLHYLDHVHAFIGLHDGNSDATEYVIKQSTWDIRVLQAHLAKHGDDARYGNLLRRALALKHCGLAYSYGAQGQRALARQEYLRALAYPGRRLHAALRWLTVSARGLLPARS